jgi:hypothetical protein
MRTKIPKDGLHIEQYENGNKKSELNYKNQKLNGLCTSWYENGNKTLEGNFKNGRPDGFLAIWYENGQKKSEENYKNGYRDGLCAFWDEKGNQKNKIKYENGLNPNLDNMTIEELMEIESKYSNSSQNKNIFGENNDVGLNSDDSDWGSYDHDTNFDIDENGNIKR